MKTYCITVWFCGTNRWYLTNVGEYDISVSKKHFDAFIWADKYLAEEVADIVRSMSEETDSVEVVEY